MVRRRNLILGSLITCSAALAIAVISCGKKSSDDAPAASTDPVASNPAALAYPTSLAISAFPTSTGTSLVADDVENSAPKAKKEEQEKLLRGEGDSCMPKIMDQKDKATTQNTCYEFDQDMIYGAPPPSGTTTYGTRDGKDSAGEACLVAFSRSKVKQVVGHVDRSLGLAQMALCQRKKDGDTTQPDVGESVDLSAAMKKVMAKATITTATMTRLADASDGAKVFSMAFDITRPDGVPMVVNIIHSPKNDANTAYTGVINAKLSVSGEDKTRFVSVVYDRTDDKMKYNLRSGGFATGLVATAIGSDGQVDFNAGAAADGTYTGYAEANKAVDGMMSVAFEGNPTTNEGTFSYWQNPGGNYSERARGMLASLTYDAATGTLAGCATSGAAGTTSDGLSIRKAIKTGANLEPNGAYHPFFNTTQNGASCGSVSSTASTDTTGSYYFCSATTAIKWYVPKGLGANGTTFATEQQPAFYSKQCFKQTTAGVYEIDAAKTTTEAGFELIAITDTTNKITPPTAPAPGTGVKKQ